MTLARRYAPLLLVLVAQLVVIVAFPSKAPNAGSVLVGGGTVAAPSATTPDGAPVGAGTDPVTGAPVDAGGTGGTAGGTGGGALPAGDTSHCVDGRQFDPKLDYFAPPCVARWAGGDNGGATSRGVTKDSIKVIQYYPRQNAAVDTIANALGAAVTSEQLRTFADKVEKYINDHYELYGRKVDLGVVQGDCVNVPPDPACFRNEFRRIVDEQQPYAIMWNSPLCSACFDELSQLGVVNIGGYHFQDTFSQARAPYHWDVQESGTQLNRSFGELWCADLAGTTAEHATNRPGNTNGRPRKLGVISANDPQNQGAVGTLKATLKGCGQSLNAEYYYSQDISTAPQQAQTALRTMRDSGVTTLLCLCDAVGGLLLIGGEGQNGYYPENVIAGFGFIDSDLAAQGFQGSVGCLEGPPCAFDGGFGLSSISAQEPRESDLAARMWHAGGGTGNPPFTTAVQVANYWSLTATLLQAAGPNLNPATMDAGVRQYGLRGGGDTGQILRGFPAGSYAWGQDQRVVYWDRKKTAPINGKPGSYVQVGPRLLPGQYRKGVLAGIPKRT